MKGKNNVASQTDQAASPAAAEKPTADTLTETEKLIADLEAKAKANLDFCSRYATNEQELLEQIRSAKTLRTAEKRCLAYVADACDGHSCERILELRKEMLNDA